ncbi:PSME3-interacting protein [Sitophilus oryzae]|uniref:PSME3-interacting protein n=1 Tax=Sitophilus oryzae TaxID=7048 RepID=A0A6J2YJG5_SITOR|nr:PSME3-interacting protein [Sitophilus oryzae]
MSSGFISEAQLAETRKRRQEEWEKVRKPSDPIERPEEPIDNRSLFERLQEQKQKKDLEYEEAHKLKNMIKGLDDDEIEFLDLVDRTKLAADRKKEIEEEKELNDYRNRVAILQEKSLDERLQAEIAVTKPKVTSGSGKLNQQKLLKGVVIKKSESVKRKMSAEGNNEDNGDKEQQPCNKQQKVSSNVSAQGDASNDSQGGNVNGSALKCVAILPGLGCYDDSSSDEDSSASDNSEIESRSRMDLLGRKIIEITKVEEPKK